MRRYVGQKATAVIASMTAKYGPLRLKSTKRGRVVPGDRTVFPGAAAAVMVCGLSTRTAM